MIVQSSILIDGVKDAFTSVEGEARAIEERHVPSRRIVFELDLGPDGISKIADRSCRFAREDVVSVGGIENNSAIKIAGLRLPSEAGREASSAQDGWYRHRLSSRVSITSGCTGLHLRPHRNGEEQGDD